MNNYRCILTLLFAVVTTVSAVAQADRQFIRNGNRLYRQQNYAKAEIEFRKAVDKNPRNAQAMYNLGCALLMQQKDSAAVVQLQNAGKAETAKARKAMVYHNIGVICQRHQMFGEAIEAYKESLRNNPNDDETRYNLALCMRQQKNQKDQNKDQNKDKQKKQQQKQDQKQEKKQDKDKDKKEQQQQQQKEQMSKDNAEQLLNYAEQEEKATQQRLNKNRSQSQRRNLQKNW